MYTHVLLKRIAMASAIGWVLSLVLFPLSHAQVSPPITSSGLNTQVSAPITVGSKTQFDITGGTRPGNGSNLFHSFGEFGVPTNNIANFLNETPTLPTSNILGRVTGGNPSNIFGTIQTTDFGNANLFLMNPAGFLFGPNATLNVGGTAAFTSADYIRLADNMRFNAIPNAGADALLSPAPVAAFGFLGSNPGAITVQGSQFTVTEGHGISLVGGNIEVTVGTLDDGSVQPARLSAPGGQINLASVASPGEILYPSFQSGPNMNGQSFTNMGAITLSEGSILDVSADAAGTIKIRGGQFVIADATLSADTVNSNGASTAIDINLTGDLSISDTRAAPAITARTSGTGNAGEVQIASANLQATSTDPDFAPFALIDAHSSGEGRAGNVNITTGNLSVQNVVGPFATWHFTDSGPQAAGPGGDTTIRAQTMDLTGTTLSTGSLLAELLGFEPSGPAGNLTFIGDSLHTSGVLFATTAFVAPIETHHGGNITMNVREINMLNTQVSTDSWGGRGGISINGDTLITDATVFSTFTAFGPGGGITFDGRIIELTNGSSFLTSTSGGAGANAGDIRVNATDHFSLIGISGANPLGEHNPSGLFTNSFGFVGTQGRSGNVFVTTPIFTIREGRINTSTTTSGGGGNVTVNAGTVTISGEFPNPAAAEPVYGITDLNPSGIFTQTVGSAFCSGSCGNAGSINLNIGSLFMESGSQLNSGTSNNGLGGTITINAGNTISMSGALSNGAPVGLFTRAIGTTPDAGSGGNINLTAGESVSISDGASVSASSTGPGNAGNISINAGQSLDLRDSSIKTEAAQASGGNIDIQAIDRVRLVNSSISTSVLGGSGSGGNITIDPNVVVLQNSQVIAQAVQGAGGNITITTPLFLADSTSLVSASSQFGLNGTVTIQSPTSNLSGSLGTLSSKPRQAQSLLTQRCAALANGQASSFVVAGREQLPADPGGWLTSSLALTGIDAERFGDGIVAEGTSNLAPRTSGLLANGTVSLRRLTPAGFLIANFADSEATGCHS